MIASLGASELASDVPNIACPNPIACPGVDSPLANLSAETADRRRFFGYAFFPDYSDLCIVDSQELADICNPPPNTNPPVPIIYSSNAQTCTLDCGDGSFESYTVASGTFVSTASQSDADDQAFAFACILAQILCDGGAITTFQNVAQTCTVPCPFGGSFSYTVPAGMFTALTQAEANANAYLFACTLALLLCPSNPPLGTVGDGQPPTQPYFGNSQQVCSFTCSDGVSVFTYTAASGLFFRPTLAEANAAALSWACRQAVAQRVCLSALPTVACADVLFANAIVAVGLTEPVTWSLQSGALPPGVIMFNDQIVGYPTTGGTYNFTIRAAGANGNYGQRAYSIRILEINPDTLPDGSNGSAYAQALSTVGEAGTVTWTVVAGSLPPGLTLNSNTGVISGTPTTDGTFAFTVSAVET